MVIPARLLAAALALAAAVSPAARWCGAQLVPGAIAATPEAPQRAVLRVGPQQALKRPSDAVRIARDGDTVEIEAGTYAGDAASWHQNNLTLRGVGGRAHLKADGARAEFKATWVIKGAGTTVENIEFSGSVVPDGNGAGIRLEGAGLTLRRCYFHHNQNGMLTGANDKSDILIENSEFAYNGTGDGQTHNIYVGRVRTFTLRFSYVHHAIVGHDVKSRALKSYIAYNRIGDEHDGRSSYSIDLPEGGLSFVIGNVIQQGPAAENTALVSYGAERYAHPFNELYVVNNTFANDFPKGGRFISVRAGAQVVRVVNNVFLGPGEMLSGPGELYRNVRARRADFVDPAGFDYHLKARAAAIGRAADPGSAYNIDLRPNAEYVHKAGQRPRRSTGKFDIGAFEFQP